MSTEVTIYEEMDKDTGGKMQYFAAAYHTAAKKEADGFREACEAVHDAHALLAKRGKEGKFSAWVENELGLSRKTAYNYLEVFEHFGNCVNITQFNRTALYELADKRTPLPVIEEAVRLADRGERVTPRVVAEIKREHADEPPRDPTPKPTPRGEDRAKLAKDAAGHLYKFFTLWVQLGGPGPNEVKAWGQERLDWLNKQGAKA